MEQLISGTMLGSKSKSTDWMNSMAKAMEDAFIAEWPIAMGDQPAPKMTDAMRLMFVAIAQGVVNHLDTHAAAFKVNVLPGGNNNHDHGAEMNIDVKTTI